MPYVRRSTILLVALLFALLGGCGNKGPLILPDKVPAPEQDKDKKKDQSVNTAPAATSDSTKKQ